MSEFKDKMYGCYNPYVRKIKLEHLNRFVTVRCPCGKCINCLRSYQKSWTMRMREEMACSKSSFFLTLTYNPENVPVGDDELILCKSDYQLFLKRLRKHYSKLGVKLRYVVVGEYGSSTDRPHFHMALFFNEKLIFNSLYKNINNCWNKGFISLEYLSKDRILYLVKYFNKLDERVHSIRHFRNMSNGIGRNFLSDAIKNYYKKNLTVEVHRYGYTYVMPRYYKDKIFNDEEREILLVDAENNYRSWISDFYRVHPGSKHPILHYKEVNENKLNNAKIAMSHFLDDDDS